MRVIFLFYVGRFFLEDICKWSIELESFIFILGLGKWFFGMDVKKVMYCLRIERRERKKYFKKVEKIVEKV